MPTDVFLSGPTDWLGREVTIIVLGHALFDLTVWAHTKRTWQYPMFDITLVIHHLVIVFLFPIVLVRNKRLQIAPNIDQLLASISTKESTTW